MRGIVTVDKSQSLGSDVSIGSRLRIFTINDFLGVAGRSDVGANNPFSDSSEIMSEHNQCLVKEGNMFISFYPKNESLGLPNAYRWDGNGHGLRSQLLEEKIKRC